MKQINDEQGRSDGDTSSTSPGPPVVVAEEGEGEGEGEKKDKKKDKEEDSSTKWITLSSALSGTIVKKKSLKPSTTYIFRYCAHDNQWTGGCTSPFSLPSISVTTLASDIIRPTPPTLMQRDSTSLTIGWDAPDDVSVSGGGPPFDLQLRLCSNTTGTVPQPWTHCATVSGQAIKKKSLLPNTKYEFRLRSSSSSIAAWSAPSVVFTTLPSFNPFKQLLGELKMIDFDFDFIISLPPAPCHISNYLFLVLVLTFFICEK